MELRKSTALLALALFLSFNVLAQDPWTMIQGSWIVYKVERKDGSAVIDRKLNDSVYLNFLITRNDITKFSDPVEKYYGPKRC